MHCERLIFASRPRWGRSLSFLLLLLVVLSASLLHAI